MNWPFYNHRKSWALRRKARHALADLTAQRVNIHAINAAQYPCFICLRNETLRLPYFLDHHRRLGVDHFIIVDNGSDDGLLDLLADERDVSVYQTPASYRAARFGMDWINALLNLYGRGKWCLTLDADELLVFDGFDRGIACLTDVLDQNGQTAFGALMVEIFANAPLGQGDYAPGQDPAQLLNWFDTAPYWQRRKQPMQNLVLQGGPRARAFFAQDPIKAPTLNKLPLVKWKSGNVYVTSTHSALPVSLNLSYDGPKTALSGALLHTKFLPDAPSRAASEQKRGQHFETPQRFDEYYQAVQSGLNLWHAGARRYSSADDLIDAGLMPALNWGQ